jgi:cell division protein FtsL
MSRSLSDIDQQIDQIEKENEDLRREIASYSSLLSLQKRAESVGFSNAIHTLTLWPGQEPMALK